MNHILKFRKGYCFPAILAFLFTLTGCSPEIYTVEIEDKEGLDCFSSMLENHPLPEGFQLKNNLAEEDSKEETPAVLLYTAENRKEEDSFLLDFEWLVPVTDFFSSTESIEENEISGFPVIPLEDLELPNKGLAVGGKYPGEPGYPLFNSLWINMKISQNIEMNTDSLTALRQWFLEVRSAEEFQEKEDISPVWIAGVGDIMLQRGVESALMNPELGSEYIFGDTLAILQSSDLMMGNLEGSITEASVKTPKSYNFRFSPEVLGYLNDAGFDYFSATNNHVYDYGETGLKDTIRNLNNSEIATSGIGLNLQEASEYSEFRVKGTTVRVLSIAAYPKERNGWNGRTEAAASENRPGILFSGPDADKALKEMASDSTFDVVMIHGGNEWESSPDEAQMDLYRKLTLLGADLVLGSHPHVLQGMEVRGNSLIAYSLGNFIFPGMETMRYAEESMIISAGIVDNKIKYLKTVPVQISGRRVSTDTTGRILERFLAMTGELTGRDK